MDACATWHTMDLVREFWKQAFFIVLWFTLCMMTLKGAYDYVRRYV